MNTHMKIMMKTMNNIIKMLNTNISFLVFIFVLSILHLFSNIGFFLFFFWVVTFGISLVGIIRYYLLNRK